MQVGKLTKKPIPGKSCEADIATNEKIDFLPAEDALIVWFFFMNQIYEYRSLSEYFSNRKSDELLSRFKEIMKSPELIKKVLKEMKGNVLGYRPSSLTPFEEFFALKAKKYVNQNYRLVLEKFPNYFMPKRTQASLAKCVQKFSDDGIKSANQGKEFLDHFMMKIRRSVGDTLLSPLPTDEVDAINELYEVRKPCDPKIGTNALRALLRESDRSIPENAFAALIFDQNIFQISHIKTILGRTSIKSEADIDIDYDRGDFMSMVSRHHAEITLANDFRFYLKVLGSELFVNTQIFLTGQTVLLEDLDVMDIGEKIFIFHENKKLLDKLRNHHK